MDDEPPPAPIIWKRYIDVPDEPKHTADDWINLLGVMNQTGERASEQDVQTFWDSWVFRSWDTSEAIKAPPAKPQGRKASEVRVCVGTFSANVTPSKAAAATGKVNPFRQPGQAVFIHPTINFDLGHIDFMWKDGHGGQVKIDEVTLRNGTSQAAAKAVAINNWDASERERIGRYDLTQVVAWARTRLVAEMRQHHPTALLPPGMLQSTITVDPSKLIKLKTCSELADAMVLDLRDIQQWTAGKESGLYSLHGMK